MLSEGAARLSPYWHVWVCQDGKEVLVTVVLHEVSLARLKGKRRQKRGHECGTGGMCQWLLMKQGRANTPGILRYFVSFLASPVFMGKGLW